MQEKDTMWKVFKLIWCCGKFKQIRNDFFVNVKIRYTFWLPHEYNLQSLQMYYFSLIDQQVEVGDLTFKEFKFPFGMFRILSPGDNSDWDKYNQMSILSVFSKVSKWMIFIRVIFNNLKQWLNLLNKQIILQKSIAKNTKLCF